MGFYRMMKIFMNTFLSFYLILMIFERTRQNSETIIYNNFQTIHLGCFLHCYFRIDRRTDQITTVDVIYIIINLSEMYIVSIVPIKFIFLFIRKDCFKIKIPLTRIVFFINTLWFILNSRFLK